jgi:diaminopimelate epimerase
MTKTLEFVKMQGTGNDFVMVDARKTQMDWKALAQKMCRYHFGIGADGLILVLNSRKADLKMRIFNADGSEAEICGNGLRCFAKYAIDRKLVKASSLTIDTLAGIKKVETVMSRGRVKYATVNMGKPGFRAAEIPVSVDKRGPILEHPLKAGKKELAVSLVSMGNPHAVCFIEEDVSDFPLAEIGPLVEHHRIFPQRTNFEIVQVVDKKHLRVRVWERGVGETLACGSGACATAVAGRLTKRSGETVDIMLPGGTLTITWDGSGDVFLKGPAEEIFTGEYLL